VNDKKYGVYIVYGKNDVKVKGANQIWYQIDQHRIKTITQQQLDLKNATLAFYQKEESIVGQLTIPPPLIINETAP
jgi:hypothetical protein